ncbi:metallophosphoesterase [Marinilabiliaceae bacterium ANBcel2]|nr:metallophosphoesterase [Marinilabiliaceae bacterium ANBcel2]
MNYQYGLVYLMIAVVAAVDLFLFWRWRKGGLFESLWGKVLALFLFAAVPITAISGMIYLGFRIEAAENSMIYRHFGWFLFIFFLIYIFKFVYANIHGVALAVSKNSIKDRFKNNHENIPAEEPLKKRHYPRFTRRKFLSQVGIVMATAPFVSLLFGAFRGRFAFYTRHMRLSFPNLPSSFDGLRIVQISDLHLGSFGANREPLNKAVDLINEEHADIILFTGDLVNNFGEEIDGWGSVFSRLKARIGKFSVLGNHDYGNYSSWNSKEEKRENFEKILKGHAKLGFKLLNNESVNIKRNGEVVALAGVENWGTASYPKRGDLEKAAEGLDKTPFKILMTHDPDHWDKKVLKQGLFDITFSGHTHGMQFGIERGDFKWSPAQYVQKHWAGLYREKDKFLYVNRGLGYHGLPARVGMPPEITVFELSRGAIGTEPM